MQVIRIPFYFSESAVDNLHTMDKTILKRGIFMTTRDKNLFFETLELLRKELQKSDDFRGQDWRDVDD